MTANRMLKEGTFKLGTFSTNCSSGMTPTKAKERWNNSWDNNLKLAQMLGSRGQDWHLLTAGGFVSMLLPLIVFFSLQRYFVRGLLAGSVKG